MNYPKIPFHRILLLFIFCFINGVSQVDKPFVVTADTVILENWELFNIDNPVITNKDFQAPNIIVKSTMLKADNFTSKPLPPIIWFRKTIQIDSILLGKSLSFNINIIGAAEIYINQKLVKTIGTVSNKEENETQIANENQQLFYPFVPGKNFVIAVRYSNHHVEYSYADNGQISFGFEMTVKESNTFFNDLTSNRMPLLVLGFIISIFFFTLSFVHLAIFLSYRTEKANLFYSLFCLTAFALSGSITSRQMIEIKTAHDILLLIVMLSLGLIFFLLPYMIRSFFKLKYLKWYLIFALSYLIYCCGIFFENQTTMITSIIILISLSSIETGRLLIIALMYKIKGVKIIITGTAIFILFISFVFFIAIYIIASKNVTIDGALGGTLIIFGLASVFSIPVSITIFLSYQISDTNKSLSQKLIEIEDLSKKTIEQEKEKQKILENQKSVLEEQVIERTSEITEQKKIIEEKNKDIIDSINYAKRIQTSILPDINYFKSVFENSLIVYQPRDIVSGDFYYVTEIEGRKILFIADCTGHGVPGALMSMVGSNLIHKIIHENRILDPKTILETLHQQMRQSLKQDQEGSGNRDGMDAAIVVIKGKELDYAGANRSLLYFNQTDELCEIKATKTPIGGSHITSIEIAQHTLNKKDVKEFYLFSDGYADQFGGVDLLDKQNPGKKLMVSRFKNWLISILNLPLEEKETFLKAEFEKWKGNLEQVDDVCVIGIRP